MSYKESLINSKILFNYFLELCENFLPPYREGNIWLNRKKVQLSDNILYFLSRVKRLINEDKCDAEAFKNEVMKIRDLNVLPLEILWYLEIAKVIALEEVLNNHISKNNETFIDECGGKIIENILNYQKNKSQVQKEMLVDFTNAVFVNINVNQECNNVLCKKMFNLITINLKKYHQFECGNDELGDSYLDFSCLLELFKLKLESDKIKLFCIQLLDALLKGPVLTIQLILKKQEKIKNNLKDTQIFKFLKELSIYCDAATLFGELKKFIYQKSIASNWDYVFPLITFIGVHFHEGWTMLKALSNSVIMDSFKNLDGNLLIFGFLIARQSCFEGTNNLFPSYLQWFSSTFSTDSKRPLKSKQICKFFFNFLSDMVPYDSSYYLKVHINRTPWVPVECYLILTEYVSLVKTQLIDLNVSTELGICENTTGMSAAVYDVEKVLKHYERTNEILNSVFQASMFSREYFEKKFLVELLSKFEGVKSVRHKLILKLHTLKKIPTPMFKKYKSLENKK